MLFRLSVPFGKYHFKPRFLQKSVKSENAFFNKLKPGSQKSGLFVVCTVEMDFIKQNFKIMKTGVYLIDNKLITDLVN